MFSAPQRTATNLTRCLLAAASLLLSQEPPPREPTIFRAETALVEVEVRATDRNGKLVVDLERKEFTLFENGRQQELATFEFVPPLAPVDSAGQEVRTAQTRASTTGKSPQSAYVYIASRVGPLQRRDTYDAVKGFLVNLPADIRVSLDGLPFTSDKRRLLELLETMLHDGGADGIPDFVHLPTASADEQIATITEFTGVTRPAYIATPPSRAHMHRVHLERVLIEGYTSLVTQFGIYPGKKVLVLFSRGLRFDAENAPYMERFAAAAMRARVTVHAIDVRGLVALPAGGGANESSLGVETRIGAGGMPYPPRPEFADRPFSQDDLRFSQQGLMSLAEMTGGRAVVNNNDLASVFSNVTEAFGGYYLLGYYPRGAGRRGRFRKVSVQTSRPGVSLAFQKGYFEDKEFSEMTKGERRIALDRLLHSNAMPNEIPLLAAFEFFRAADGRPQVAYCAGIKSRSIPADRTDKGLEIDLTMTAMAESIDGGRVPFRDEQSLHLVFKPDEFKRMRDDSTAMLQFPSTLKLPPGRYRWKVIVRDEVAGSVGAYQTIIDVPVFGGAASPSSLMMTGQFSMRNTSDGVKEDAGSPRGIDIDKIRLYPQPANVFRQGKTVYAIYDLYNVPPELLQSPPGPRVFLLRGAAALENPPFRGYEVRAQPQGRSLRYAASLDTTALEPANYKLAALLPNGKDAIVAEFTIVP